MNIITHLRSGVRLDPERDWLVLVMGSLVALSGIVVWNTWAFDTMANAGVMDIAATSTPPVLRKASLDAVRTVCVARAAEESKYVSGEYRYVDPSQ